MSKSECINCGKEVIDIYCHHCGQKQISTRLSWSVFFDDLQKRLFGFDNNFFRTVKDLTVAPSRVINSCIDGIRVRYIGPVGYYFLLITIFVLVISFFDIDMAAYTKDIANTLGQPANANQEAFQQKINDLIFSNFRIFSFLMMPFFITGVWLVFKNKKYNFIESSVIVFYAQGHPVILSIIGILGYQLFGLVHLQTYIAPVSYIYFAMVCASFYEGNKVWNFIKGLLGMLLGFLLFMLLVLTLVLITAFVNPTLFKTMG